VRIARERITTLFALAEVEASRGHPDLANRYVTLARRIGTRYNVRLLPEFREMYCRGCSVFWSEGRTVRTRLRAGRRVRTCLRCGRVRRVRVRPGSPSTTVQPAPGPSVEVRKEAAFATEGGSEDSSEFSDDESEPE
jgi:ribonuclease P protein subunit RPR2